MKQFQKVTLTTDKYISDGLQKGAIGYILEDYGDGHFEVEFSDKSGITIALFAFPESELEIAE